MGMPVTVTVDDYLVFDNGYNSLEFAGLGNDGSLWGPILEKAAAKLYGNYEMLQGGWMGPAVHMLTGAPYFETWHEGDSDEEAEKMWRYVKDKLDENWMVTTASMYGTGRDSDYNDLGIPNNHAFTVLGTYEVLNGVKLYKMRNPWGSEKYKGDWSDNSELWTEELKR